MFEFSIEAPVEDLLQLNIELTQHAHSKILESDDVAGVYRFVRKVANDFEKGAC